MGNAQDGPQNSRKHLTAVDKFVVFAKPPPNKVSLLEALWLHMVLLLKIQEPSVKKRSERKRKGNGEKNWGRGKEKEQKKRKRKGREERP